MRLVQFVTTAAVVTLLALSWQAQRGTNRRLDALAAAVAAKPEALAPAEPGPLPAVVPADVPRELDKVPLPAYVIEAPDVLVIEAAVRDRKGDGAKPLPMQPLTGSYLVAPDGTANLGQWGGVIVAGLTLPETAEAVRKAVAGHPISARAGLTADDLIVTVDVKAYNSKVYYVFVDEAAGEQLYKFPCTGGDTVLDAVAHVGAVGVGVGKKNVWVARPAPAGGPQQILPVDWAGITQQGVTATNYQLLPGDRVYVKAGK